MVGCVKTVNNPSFCQTARPIYVGEDDIFSTKTADQVLFHNCLGQRLCGWGGEDGERSCRF
ncbi:hypothetical protein [Salmonella phage SD-11_S17]|nr:hypothetical protein [Salmonella phage SD-11_S17]WPK20342.1 hypothetical protein [Salmonella phage SD-12_S18]